MPLVHSTARNREARARGEAALLAAVEELVAGGTPYSELGIGQIAKAAGFSRATFYAYFTDKRDLRSVSAPASRTPSTSRSARGWRRATATCAT